MITYQMLGLVDFREDGTNEVVGNEANVRYSYRLVSQNLHISIETTQEPLPLIFFIAFFCARWKRDGAGIVKGQKLYPFLKILRLV